MSILQSEGAKEEGAKEAQDYRRSPRHRPRQLEHLNVQLQNLGRQGRGGQDQISIPSTTPGEKGQARVQEEGKGRQGLVSLSNTHLRAGSIGRCLAILVPSQHQTVSDVQKNHQDSNGHHDHQEKVGDWHVQDSRRVLR